MSENTEKKIHNPVTGKYYPVRDASRKHGTKKEVKGLWCSDEKERETKK